MSGGPRVGLAVLSLASLLIAIFIAPSTIGMFLDSCCDERWTWMWAVPAAALPILFIALALAAAWDAFTSVSKRWSIVGGLLIADIVLSICAASAFFFLAE